jgi:arabinogalactan endo-1,4-beta-galactosidase
MTNRPSRQRRSARLALLGRALAGGVVLALTALPVTAAGAAAPQRGTLPPLPDGLNAAVGRHVTAGSGSAPGTRLSSVVDGDGTSRWCPGTVGPQTVTVDLGKATDITGTGVTFSGEEGNDGSFYSVTTGLRAPGSTPLPHQAAGDRNGIVQGPLYLFAGSDDDVSATVRARYVTLHFQVPREQNICVQEFRVFSDTAASTPDLQLGGDLTNLAADDAGSWTASGVTAPVLPILRTGGLNYGRVQVLVDPANCQAGCADLANGLAVAKRLEAAGMKISLDLEYADTPTSSMSQPTPAAWAGQDAHTLARTVHDYTRSVVAAFARNGTPVSQVSLGDDITQGLLWPTGRLDIGTSGSADWSRLTTLLAAGAQGVQDGSPRGSRPLVQLSLDSGADNAATADVVSHVVAAHVPFDVIGLAYAPWQQGSLSALKANLDDLAGRFHKRLVVSESQFPYADIPGYGTYSTAVPYPDTLPGYLISPAGQASYERDLVSMMATLPGGEGGGVFYSTPDTAGSTGLFTADGVAQPAAFADRVGSGATLYQGRSAEVTRRTTGPVSSAGVRTLVAPAVQPTAPAAPAAAQSGLPPIPRGLDAAIGAKAMADSSAAPGTSVGNAVDGDGTTAWCPSTVGAHTLTVDLGKVTDITGTGVTFSGQLANDGSSYSVTTGLRAPDSTPFPHQAAGDSNAVAQGPLYLFAGSADDPSGTVKARYLTLHFQVPREQSICVQEFRVFSPSAGTAASELQLGADLSTLVSDNTTYTLNGTSAPILSIFKTGGLNYVRLRLWINPGSPDCSPAGCPSLANDLTMAKQVKAAGMKLLLDFHYSDTWADPQHQNVPSAWAGQTLPQLTTSIHDYTRSVVEAFAANGTPVDQVAIGNEITQGTVWAATSVVGGSTTAVAGSTALTAPAAGGATVVKVPSTAGFAAGQSVVVGSGAQAQTAVVASVGTASRATTAAEAAAAGDTVVKVASVTGWAAGDTVTVGIGADQETRTVTAVGTAGAGGTGVTLDRALDRAHRAGVTVVDQGTGITLAAALGRGHAQGEPVATVVPAGTSTLRVASTTGFVPGQTVAVDSGAAQETLTVASAGTGSTGATLTFTAPLARDHTGPVTVATATPAGTTTLKVAATGNIRVGDELFVDAGANLVPDQLTETATVAAVGTPGQDGTGITLSEPLQLDHAGPVTVQDVQASGKLLFDPKTGAADWTSLTTLIKAGAEGAQEGNPAHHPMLIQLHVDRGGDNTTTVDWISHMVAAGVPFDVIGESYYPWYHGPMTAMRANLTDLVLRFHKYVMIAEDQFPQNPQGGYGTYNAANANYPDTLPGYPVTPTGQLSYQRDLNSIVASLPEGRGLGVFYWDGDGQGNLGMFNQQHQAQPVVYADQIR